MKKLKTDLSANELRNHVEKELCERSLSHYLKAAWKVVEPDTPLLWNWHHDLICEYLEAVYLGQIKRLIINQPPRTMKSIPTTVCGPTWAWLRQPSLRFLFGPYAEELAVTHSMARRDLITSARYQKFWKNRFKLSDDQNQKRVFSNDKTGKMLASGLLGSITGEGADVIVIDDPHNPKKAESDAERSAALRAFDLAWTTRLNDKKKGAIIITMQRLHERDLTGHILEKDAGYIHLKVPMIAEQKTTIVFPISGKVHVREENTLLHPDRDGWPEVNQSKKELGSYGHAGQNQQEPSPSGGGILKKKWWRYYDIRPARFDWIGMFWDMSFKDTDASDYVVGAVIAKAGANKFFLDLVRARLDFPATLKAFLAMVQKWPEVNEKIVEDKANGPAIIATLKNKIPGLIAFSPDTSKEARARAASPEVEAGNWHLPNPRFAPWVDDFIEECAKFPNGAHDDQVDVLTMAFLRFQGNSAGNFDESMVQSTESLVHDIIGEGDKW